jgi:hypothetical protein
MLGISTVDSLFSGWKVWAAILIALAVIGGAFSAGWAVNGWRKDAAYATDIKDLTAEVNKWKSQVRDQNAAADLLNEKKIAADERRKLAADMSKATLAAIARRDAGVDGIVATDCEGVLKEAHGDAR